MNELIQTAVDLNLMFTLRKYPFAKDTIRLTIEDVTSTARRVIDFKLKDHTDFGTEALVLNALRDFRDQVKAQQSVDYLTQKRNTSRLMKETYGTEQDLLNLARAGKWDEIMAKAKEYNEQIHNVAKDGKKEKKAPAKKSTTRASKRTPKKASSK